MSGPEAPLELRFEWYDSIPAIFKLGRDWDRWLEEWGVDCTFLRWDWIRTWLRVYGPGCRPMFGVLRSGGKVCGLAPLQIVRQKVTPIGPVLRTVSVAGDGPLCPDHLVLPVAPGYEDAYARLLSEELRRRAADWDRIELHNLLETHPAWQKVEAAARTTGFAPRSDPRTHCPYMRLPATWDEYLAALDRDDRKTLNYRFRRLERELGAVITEPSTVREVDALMRRLEELHELSWKHRGQPGVFADPRFRLFHRVHARRAFRSGHLILLGLGTAERVVAATLVFRRKDAAEGYQAGHDPSLAALGVGSLMVASVLRYAIEHGLTEMDMLRGTGSYKYKLAGDERRGIDLSIGRGTPSDRAATFARGTRRVAGGVLRSALDRRRIDRVKQFLRIRS